MRTTFDSAILNSVDIESSPLIKLAEPKELCVTSVRILSHLKPELILGLDYIKNLVLP
jgi:hypothetical protein